MKKIICVFVSLLIALLALAGCSGGAGTEPESGSAAAPSGEPTKLTVALDWTPNTNHTGLYVAAKNGYFADAGLDVDVVFVDGDSSAQLCASGRAQFAVEAQDTLAAAYTTDDPLGITAIAAILQHNTSGIISRKGDGITSAAGMQGKTYSTWNSPIELAMLKQLVEKEGGDWNEVKLIPNDITDEPGALSANRTDAIWVFYGWSVINAQVQDFAYDWFYLKDVDPTFDYYTPVLIGNDEYMAANPELTKAFLAAVKKGYEWSAANPDAAAQILIESDDTGALAGTKELVEKSQIWMADEYLDENGEWGRIDADRWNAFYGWLNDNDLVSVKIPENTGFTNEYFG